MPNRIADPATKINIVTQEINYSLDKTQLKGFLAYPSGRTHVPGVLVVHEWWGHNDYARQRAKMLAELGYAAFALDMYGDGKVASHPKDANAFMMEVMSNASLATARFNKGLQMLTDQPFVDKQNLAAIGYCMGGNLVLSSGRSGAPFKAVVSFHGALGGLSPVSPNNSTEFLVLNGQADSFISADVIADFKKDMDKANAHYEFINYPNAKHGFTNPAATAIGATYGLPLEYNAAADAESWAKMQALFKKTLGVQP